jgi:L-ornithine N5-oxygenase
MRMSDSSQDGETLVYDLVGVGFGPANLALAIAVHEDGRAYGRAETIDGGPRMAFLERQPHFGWHRGMLIDGATMQVSFMKDLVTIRNPTSPYSFLSYLHDRGRLVDFVNHKCLFPSRVEFHDYLEWAAAGFEPLVRYGHEVIDIRPVEEDSRVSYLDVVARDTATGETSVLRTRNVVLAPGLEPFVPDGVTLSGRIWHNRDLLDRVANVPDPARLLVVGAGQSAAETAEFLHRRYPAAEICSVFTRYGYSPADDSPFANRIFDPEAVGAFYSAPSDVKSMLMNYHRNTNYSVVDPELIEELYRRVYQEKVSGNQRLRLFNVSRVREMAEDEGGVRAVIESLTSGEKTVLDADVVVYATGYRPADPRRLLGASARLCRQDPTGDLRVERDYRVTTGPGVDAGIYLQGATEHTHGVTSSLLSNTAVRAGEIAGAILSDAGSQTGRRYAFTGD